MTQAIRHQPSGAQNRRASGERAQALAAAGQLELKFPVAVADCDPLLRTGDLSEDDLTTGGRLSVAMTELLPDMVRYYARTAGGGASPGALALCVRIARLSNGLGRSDAGRSRTRPA